MSQLQGQNIFNREGFRPNVHNVQGAQNAQSYPRPQVGVTQQVPTYGQIPSQNAIYQSRVSQSQPQPLARQTQDKPKQLANICGKVQSFYTKKVDFRTNVKIITVKTLKSQEEYTLLCDSFCPIEEGDTIECMCTMETDPNTNKVVLTAIEPPFVQIGLDRKSLTETMVKILRGKGFGDIKANRLYDLFLQNCNGDPNMVSTKISDLAKVFKESKETSLFEPYKSVITEKQMTTLLGSWIKKRDKRRLWLLGLTNRDINSVEDKTLDQIYHNCIDNPYTLVELPIEKCNEIVKRTKKQFTTKDLRAAVIARRVHRFNEKSGWTSVPSPILGKIYPDAGNHFELLQKDYGMVADLSNIYLPYPFLVETTLADYIVNKVFEPRAVSETASYTRGDLTDEQREAIQGALDNKISIIYGPAGTGKTTIIAEIVYNLELLEIPYKVVSFTGKAVARLKEVLKKKSPATMDRLIARKTTEKILHLIVDESSMVKSSLFYKFIQIYSGKFKVTFIGDPNQLPPIGWGSLFEQIILSQAIQTFYLGQIHRLENGGITDGILFNSSKLLSFNHTKVQVYSSDLGDVDTDFYYGEEEEDYQYDVDELEKSTTDVKAHDTLGFSFVETDNFHIEPGSIDKVRSIVKKLYEQGVKSKDIVVLTPYKYCIPEINSIFQEVFNDGQRQTIDRSGRCWMLNDRIQQLNNNYKEGIMNGEEGFIVDLTDTELAVKFNDDAQRIYKICDGKVDYMDEHEIEKTDDEDDLDKFSEELSVKDISIAWSITVHRSQGSEWKYVIVYVNSGKRAEQRDRMKSKNDFLNKRLLYTAITRAKKEVYLSGNIDEIIEAAKQPLPLRIDNMCKRIQDKINEKMKHNVVPEGRTLLPDVPAGYNGSADKVIDGDFDDYNQYV